MVIDSNDLERMDGRDEGGHDTVKDLLWTTLREDELKDAVVLVLCNKQDLPGARSVPEIEKILNIEYLKRRKDGTPCAIKCFATCGVTGDGVLEGMKWMVAAVRNGRDTAPPEPPKKEPVKEQEVDKMEALLMEWLQREDEDDAAFIEQLENYTLESWDHYTHLRIAWVILSRHGRQEGLPKIFTLIRNFIANSGRTKRSQGTTFHETMTYFWVHMIHYAMAATKLPRNDFKTFLLMNPQLVNGGLFLHYYSRQRMLLDADARTMVLLPDKRPLPSVLSDVSGKTAGKETSAGVKVQPQAPLTDQEFLSKFELGELPSWGHDSKIRLVYLYLCLYGRSSRTVDLILARLAGVEKANAHVTLNYFWIQMATYHMQAEGKANPGVKFGRFAENGAASGKTVFAAAAAVAEEELEISAVFAHSMPVSVFYQLPHCQALRNMLLYEKYYSNSVIDAPSSATELALPNLKPFPSLV